MDSLKNMKRVLGSFMLASLVVTVGHAESNVGTHGTLLQYDFNGDNPWPHATASGADVGLQNVGTIDVAHSQQASGGMLLTVGKNAVKSAAVATLSSGLLAVTNGETNLGKLTLSFDHSAPANRPMVVRIESFNAKQKRTGGLETTVYPAAADFFQRSALELSTMKPVGKGAFVPTDPFVQISFVIAGAAELRIDNVAYATPAFYVRPDGSDTNDGRTEQTAFASPQKAVDAAQPGDIIVLMDGTYAKPADQPAAEAALSFVRSGTPAGWITLKNYPAHQPVISSAGQQAVRIFRAAGSTDELGYVEVRGLHIRGNADTAREQFPAEIGKSTPNTDSRGLFVFGRGAMVHHVRLADNTVEFCTADGIYVDSADWVSIEHNRVLNNCWTSVGYAPSGLTVMKYANFDATENNFKFLIAGNLVSGNKLTVKNSPWGKEPKTGYHNGNGILIDDNGEHATPDYLGRTLVQNNVVFNNGAGGIQMWGNHRMDVVNNTVCLNGTVIGWGEVGLERCQDVRLVNNIIFARPDRTLDQWFAKQADRGTTNIVRMNNLYFGGILPPVNGAGMLIADPQFVNFPADVSTADFNLKPGSPAMDSGLADSFMPSSDFQGGPRPLNRDPDRGAFQH